MAFYLDALRADTGALRVMPGSHRVGDEYADAVEAARQHDGERYKNGEGIGPNWGMDGSAVPAVVLETIPGDVVLFDENLKHASFGGGGRRRMCTPARSAPLHQERKSELEMRVTTAVCMSFIERFAEHELDDLIGLISNESRFWCDSVIGPEMRRTASAARRVHLEQAMAADGRVAELAAQKRVEMDEPSRG